MDNEPDTQETESSEASYNTNESEIARDEDGFSSLIGMLGRQGNRNYSWTNPIGCQSN